MNITIEVGGPLAEAINRLADALVSAKQTDVIIEKASTKARAKKPVEPEATPAPESVSIAEPAAESGSPETAAPAEEETLTIEIVRAKLSEVVKAGKSDAVKTLLAEYGATAVSTLKPEHFRAVVDRIANL